MWGWTDRSSDGKGELFAVALLPQDDYDDVRRNEIGKRMDYRVQQMREAMK